MSDLISRQAAIEAFRNMDLQIYAGNAAIGRYNSMTREEAIKTVLRMPTMRAFLALARVVHYLLERRIREKSVS